MMNVAHWLRVQELAPAGQGTTDEQGRAVPDASRVLIVTAEIGLSVTREGTVCSVQIRRRRPGSKRSETSGRQV